MSDDELRLSREGFIALLKEGLPGAKTFGLEVVEVAAGRCLLRLPANPAHVRPGGSFSGPSMMILADTAIYGAVLSRIGPEPMAVTTDLNFHFMRRPPVEVDLWGEAQLLKLGRRLATARVEMWSGEDRGRLVSFAMGTYALPPAPTPA